MRPILFLDSYDSFSASLVDLCHQAGASVEMVPNDSAIWNDDWSAEALAERWAGIILGPGPGRPESAGVMMPLLRWSHGRVPVLGICLGHQAIALHHGASLRHVAEARHGTRVAVSHRSQGLFATLPSPIGVGVYNSLTVDASTLPATLEVQALAPDGEVMALAAPGELVLGLQFHPESALSEFGLELVRAWFAAVCAEVRPPREVRGASKVTRRGV